MGSIHVAGPPCVDFSAAGLRRRLQGPTAKVLATWALLVLRYLPDTVVHENVLGFTIDELARLLSTEYTLDALELSPDCFNCPVARRRRFSVFRRRHLRAMRPLAGLLPALGVQRTKVTGRIYSWDDADKSSAALTAHQRANLQDYQRFARSSCRRIFMADLSQNWRSRPKISLATGCLPTLTTTAGWWFDLDREQFYSARELLAMQGLPASSALALRLRIGHCPGQC